MGLDACFTYLALDSSYTPIPLPDFPLFYTLPTPTININPLKTLPPPCNEKRVLHAIGASKSQFKVYMTRARLPFLAPHHLKDDARASLYFVTLHPHITSHQDALSEAMYDLKQGRDVTLFQVGALPEETAVLPSGFQVSLAQQGVEYADKKSASLFLTTIYKNILGGKNNWHVLFLVRQRWNPGRTALSKFELAYRLHKDDYTRRKISNHPAQVEDGYFAVQGTSPNTLQWDAMAKYVSLSSGDRTDDVLDLKSDGMVERAAGHNFLTAQAPLEKILDNLLRAIHSPTADTLKQIANLAYIS